MDRYLSTLQKNPLFKGIPAEELLALLQNLKIYVSSYPSGEIIVSEGETATRMGIIISGKVEAQKLLPSGKAVTIACFEEHATIAEAAILAAPAIHHATIAAKDPSEILFIPKQELFILFDLKPDIAIKLLEIFANRIILLNQKIELLILESTRQKIAYFLLKEIRKQKSAEKIVLPFSKKVLAEHMNITRPSLSRELNKMCEEGYISMSGRRITIHDSDVLEDLMLYK